MKMIMDESSADLTRLLGELRVMTPEVLGCSERRLILPRKLGDLEKPECLQDMKDKIQKLKLAKDISLISRALLENLRGQGLMDMLSWNLPQGQPRRMTTMK